MILNKKLGKKTLVVASTLIILFVVYILHVAYGIEKAITYYNEINPSYSSGK